MIFSAQGARPLHAKGTRIFTISSFHQHSININSRGSVISCGSTRFFKNIGVLRLRRITQRRSMALQSKQCQQESKTRYLSKQTNEHGHQPAAESDQKYTEGQGAFPKYSSTWSHAGCEPAGRQVQALQASTLSGHRVPRTAT